MLLLAQLIAPPLQPGPVRLPEPAPIEPSRPKPKDGNSTDETPILDSQPVEQPARPRGEAGRAPTALPTVQGSRIYSPDQLRQIFATCGRPTPKGTLQACAAALTARFVADGYVNTRVYVLPSPAPGALEVVEGRIAEIRIIAANPRFSARIRRLLRPLQGTVLNLPTLDRQIQQLKRWPGIARVQGSIGRLGSDPSQASLTLRVEQQSEPLRGELSLRNDGNAGNGQWRAVGTLLQNSLIADGDTLLVYGEGDMDNTPDLGAVITSLSYAYPLSDNVRLTGSFGYSRRNLVEGPLTAQQWSFRQFQGYGQLEWVFKQSLKERWYAFGGVSLNRNDSYAGGRPFPLLNTLQNFTTNTGFFRFGLGINGVRDRSSWSATVYGLQGANGFSPQNQLTSLGNVGVIPGQATALGLAAGLSTALSPNATLSLRGAGQIALNPLIADMGFTIGSDTGIRGLPGQTISGDSGYLGSAEIAWSIWRQQNTTVQLVPFVGYGGVNRKRTIKGVRTIFNNGIGAGGVLVRLLAGANWQVELGWVSQIDHLDQLDNAIWGSDYLIGRGLYSAIKYRF
jgi:hemolysin activation/secretion protein